MARVVDAATRRRAAARHVDDSDCCEFASEGIPALDSRRSIMTTNRKANQQALFSPSHARYDADISSAFDGRGAQALVREDIDCAKTWTRPGSWRNEMKTSGEAIMQILARLRIAGGREGLSVGALPLGRTISISGSGQRETPRSATMLTSIDDDGSDACAAGGVHPALTSRTGDRRRLRAYADDERRMSDCLGPFPFSALFESETIARLRLLEAAGGSAIYDADRRSDDGRRYFRAFRAA